MNKAFCSIWSEALGSWVAVAETTKQRGKRTGSAVAGRGSGGEYRAPLRSLRRIAIALGFSVTTLPAATAYASNCGDGSTVTSGGTCALSSFSPATNSNQAGAVAVSGGDAATVSGAWTGSGGQSGYSRVPLGSTTIVSGDPNQQNLILGGRTQSVSTSDPITGANTTIATYNSNNFATSNWSSSSVPVFQDVNGDQYVDTRIGTVASTGGTLDVNVGDPANAPSAAGNSIVMAAKQSSLVYADGTGAASSVINWDSRNQIVFTALAPNSTTNDFTMQVPVYAGTFQAFDGSAWTVTDAASLATYNDFLVQSLQSGALNSPSAYDSAFNQAVAFSTQTVQYANNLTPGDTGNLPVGTVAVMRGTGQNALLHVAAGGELDTGGQVYAALAENGAKFVNDGQLSGTATLVALQSGAQGVNNGVISAGYASGGNFNTGTATLPDNFGLNNYAEGYAVDASGAGTSFVNNGIMNVAAWTYSSANTSQLNYAVAVSDNAVASNAGIINVGVNPTKFESAVVGGLVDGGSFTNLADGTIYLGRAAQYDASAPEAVADVELSAHTYGIVLGSSGNASNLGNITIGTLTQNATAMASVDSTSGVLNNSGNIAINGAMNVPFVNVGMLASNSAATITNTGTITLNGVNGIGIEVLGTGSTPTAATSTGTINVAGGADPASGTRNYGVWAQGANATATIDGAVNLTGEGAIGVHARDGATINVSANAVPDFVSGANQIGFYAYGAGSSINVAAQNLTVGTDDSTLFRVAGGASYSGLSTAGTLTSNVDGQGARGVVATGAGTTLATGTSVYNVNGANGVAIVDEGGANGTIDAGTTINLNATGAIAGVVDGQAHDLSNAASGTAVATQLTNNAAVTSSTAGVTGFVAQNLGTLINNNTITLSGAGSTGVVVGPQGTVDNAATIRVTNGTGALVQGATATLSNSGTIRADDGVAAVHLTGAGASVALSGAGSIVAGGSADGVLIDATDTGGGVSAGATSISVSGSGHGINNLGANSTIALTGTHIDTTGNASDGISSTGAGATISADSATTITTSGDDATGLYVTGAGSRVTNASATIATSGDNAVGVEIGSGGSAVLAGARVSSTGQAADGVVATDGAAVTLDTSTVKTAGDRADGIVARNGASIVATGSSIDSAAANGARADSGGALSLTGTTLTGVTSGIVMSDTLANGAASAVTVTGGSVASSSGPAFLADGANAALTVQGGAAVSAGNGTLLSLVNGSNVTMTAAGENLTGDIVSDATSSGNVLLTNQTTLTGRIATAALTLDATSNWNVSANSTLSNLVNAGTVAFVAPSGDPAAASSYKTVSTASYVGNGGTLALNTYLGADDSPTDQLIVNGGAASGTSALKITNTGGPGALTTRDGIPVVVTANGATTSASAFHLAAPVQSGAYEYLLYRGGQSSADNWYLRSYLLPGSGDPSPPFQGGLPRPAPIAYRPGVVGYTLTPALNADYGFEVLGRMHERVGDIVAVERQQPANRNGVWGRIGGQSLDANANDRFSADAKTFFAQFGKDWTLDQTAGKGSTHAGVTVTFGTASASFSDSARSINESLSNSTGSMNMHAQSVGGYWTRYLGDGTYFDSVAQLTHYENSYSDVNGNAASQHGFGVALSQEIGKPFQIGSSAVAVEPQAQLMYQYLKLNRFSDNVSDVSGTTMNALRGRVGVRVFNPDLYNETRTSAATPYFTADVLHDFLAPGQTVVGGTPFRLGLARTWYELGVGVTAGFGKRGEFYANVKYARNLGGEYRQGVFGNLGYRYSW
ncbi:autotransporter outer membrane beta-barrel domain-containing protein [Burkholderia sp. SRS-W-2-2016]|uniref:autotransporter outer membrane beta-barrel domain-containing protein n=1 Tax=Burkholderia sp. SRS-W-2-2016 TaxID=1926878 RepID=UPI00094AA515|nr:autotransporter outer membrane beta-barrel domain-containing protein [Burkholderia sp. SRS-W-2-2016]OLL27486.1 autotransporter outer membrane beta-barrel domain-containing protein [Burkholderia sp. SRS-W-2-2016]